MAYRIQQKKSLPKGLAGGERRTLDKDGVTHDALRQQTLPDFPSGPGALPLASPHRKASAEPTYVQQLLAEYAEWVRLQRLDN